MAHPHHPAAPATPTPPPAPQPLNWSFPFAPKSGSATDPQTWLTALAGADGGFYPLGRNGMFHGGIHFDAGTGSDLKQGDGVKVIADGEVVAYRLDSAYPELTYPTTPPRYALYSTAFVLVRHKLVLPPEPKPAGSPGGAGGAQTPQNDPPPADEVLEFYSLYMHQLDWAGYQAAEQADSGSAQSAPSIHRLPFWQGDRLFRVGAKAKDKLSAPPADPVDGAQPTDTPQTGARICDRASGSAIGLLPHGGELNIVGNGTKGWAQIATIKEGTPVATAGGDSAAASAATGWVNLDELDRVTDPKPLDAVVVLDTPFKVRAGDVVGYLGEYQLSAQSSVLPPQPMRPLLHVEVFTGARINDFITKSRERANKLGDKVPGGKPLLVIQPGAKFVKPSDAQSNTQLAGLTLALASGDPGRGYWAKVQPTRIAAQPGAHGHGHKHPASGTPVGNPLWVERRYAGKVAGATVQTWADFPLKLANAQGSAVGYQEVFSRAQLDQLSDNSKATEENKGQGTPAQWWEIDAGDGDGKAFYGWVCEKAHPETLWQSPWAWPDFDTVDTTGIPVIDMYRRNLFETKQLLDGEEQAFTPVAAKVNATPFITKLEKAARRRGSGKGSMVVPADLKDALTVPWLAEVVSHLIVRYASEWGGDMSKWETLSPLMGDDGKPIWQAELERIEKLKWWDKVSAVNGFPASPDVWHIHPIGLVGNFQSGACDCKARFEKVSRIVLLNEGGFVNDPSDSGGATNKGIAWATWQAYAKEDVGVEPTLANLKVLTDEQAKVIYFRRYWQPRGFCGFSNEKTALNIYDWTITSGKAIQKIQELMISDYSKSIEVNNKMSKLLVDQINSVDDQEGLVQKIGAARKKYYTSLAYDDKGKPNKNHKFLDGWIKRVDRCLDYRG